MGKIISVGILYMFDSSSDDERDSEIHSFYSVLKNRGLSLKEVLVSHNYRGISESLNVRGVIIRKVSDVIAGHAYFVFEGNENDN